MKASSADISRTMRSVLMLLAIMALMALEVSSQSSSVDEDTYYSASDDASWAIYSKKLSSMLGPEKQEIYDSYIRKCNAAVASERGTTGFCSLNDNNRLRQNQNQPPSVYNYTSLGFEKIRTPPNILKLIQNFYFENTETSVTEWASINTYQNLWDIPSTIVRLEDPNLKGGGEALKSMVWQEAQKVLEAWTGQKLAPVSCYGIREYHRGSVLAPHVDRMPLITSAIINVDQRGIEEPWPLEVYGHDGKATNVTMEVGDMILYESHSVIHGRPFPLRGDLYANIFLHFEPSETSSSDSDSGLPPYIIPGSAWESSWRSENPDGWKVVNSMQQRPTVKQTAKQTIWGGDAKQFMALAKEKHGSLNHIDENGWNTLHEAVRSGSKEIVQTLLEYGFDINQATHHKQTPLDLAKQHHGQEHELTQFLVESGAVEAEL